MMEDGQKTEIVMVIIESNRQLLCKLKAQVQLTKFIYAMLTKLKALKTHSVPIDIMRLKSEREKIYLAD